MIVRFQSQKSELRSSNSNNGNSSLPSGIYFCQLIYRNILCNIEISAVNIFYVRIHTAMQGLIVDRFYSCQDRLHLSESRVSISLLSIADEFVSGCKTQVSLGCCLT